MLRIFGWGSRKCSCREAWRDERLSLLTRVSDLEARNERLQETSREERERLHKSYLELIRPSSRAPQIGNVVAPIKWPGTRPEMPLLVESEEASSV